MSFRWKGNRIRTVIPATNATDAKRIDKAVKTAFKIGTYRRLDPEAQEFVDILESLRKGDGRNAVKAMGLIFTYSGRFKHHSGTYHGKPIDRLMIRKSWNRSKRIAGLGSLQVRDFRHTWKTNAQRSRMDPAARNLIAGHSTERSVEDRCIRVSDEELLRAIDEMCFDNGCTELDWVEEA